MRTSSFPYRIAGVLCALLVQAGLVGTAIAAPLLDPVTHPKFVHPLPIAARFEARAGDHFEMQMNETVQWLGLVDQRGDPLLTTVWGYGFVGSGVSYPGPTFVTYQNEPITVRWNNLLPAYNFPHGPGPHLLPVDPTVHIAHPMQGGVPLVTHLHGGHSESASDGLPEAWFTQGFAETGHDFVKETYRYDNDQEAGTLWYHDHALGITRLNVYAGLAGFYLLRDANELRLIDKGILPGGPYEIEMAVQDRMFDSKGALFYPSSDPEIEPGFERLPPGPSAIAEFFGDFILVNSVAWPKLEVEPRKYRFRVLNGSDSRFYVFELSATETGPAIPLLQIGTDDALLRFPVAVSRLLLGPGERADLVVDFSGYPMGTELVLRNFGPDGPFKGFNPDGTLNDGEGDALDPADPMTTGQIMRFAVTKPLDPNWPMATVNANTRLRRGSFTPPTQTGPTRSLVLFEGRDQYGRLQPLLGTLAEGSKAWFESITEYPKLNDVEVWEVYNATEDAHPIHLHLVAFQILDRRSFEGTVEERPQPQEGGGLGVGGILHVEEVSDDVRPPEPNEIGLKDTAVMLPGEVTRVIARFDRPGLYVWHCHILSHEDHEMMRPYEVLDPMNVPPMADGRATEFAGPDDLVSQGRGFSLSLERATPVDIRVYSVSGAAVRTIAEEIWDSGVHLFEWDGRKDDGQPAARGVYFMQVRTPHSRVTHKVVRL